MKHALGGAVAVALLTSIATAEQIKPTAVSFVDGSVEQSLTGQPGDPVEGRKVFANRKQGNCLACHTNPDLAGDSFHGEVGPTMD
ncbi:MAG: sulfur oxidation c-type cytochrome SoxX, partial [Pseudomonadota bacterium]